MNKIIMNKNIIIDNLHIDIKYMIIIIIYFTKYIQRLIIKHLHFNIKIFRLNGYNEYFKIVFAALDQQERRYGGNDW